jgi:pantetheine-phosphate adenylyltransferase
MATAVYPGSFDPPTLGHLDIIQRAAAQFDRVVVCVMYNSAKSGLFTPEERLELLQKSLAGLPGVDNVEIDRDSGLLVDYVRRKKATCVVKGLRSVGDFEYELQMADVNRKLSGVETVFLTARPELSFLSSTIVRELGRYQVELRGSVSDAVAEEIARRIRERLLPGAERENDIQK